ncbi:hypothetical protein [Streptomyces sp. NPDC085596]|uniref:hypothetical protein n=1 Tax=Streptomyces sp. NPDC085596 TaxID=3365731 RepID=UPI0037D29943
MNPLTSLRYRREPDDWRGPFDPVRAAIRREGRAVECHRCGEPCIPDLVHLADRDGWPLCPTCGRYLGVALRRGLLALNQLAHALVQPHVHPVESLVWDWRTALEAAHSEEDQLLRAAAQLLAAHVGYRPDGFTANEITAP